MTIERRQLNSSRLTFHSGLFSYFQKCRSLGTFLSGGLMLFIVIGALDVDLLHVRIHCDDKPEALLMMMVLGTSRRQIAISSAVSEVAAVNALHIQTR